MSFLHFKFGWPWLAVGVCVALLAAPGSVAAAGSAATGAAPAVGASASAIGSAVLDGRNADSNDYLNPDGSHTVGLLGEPVNYRTRSGAWQPIDNTLTADPAVPGAFRNGANSWHVRFGSTIVGVTVNTDAGGVVVRPVNGRAVAPRITAPPPPTGTCGRAPTWSTPSPGRR